MCGNEETYFIDRWQGPGSPAILLSYENHHTLESEEIGKALEETLQVS